MPQLPNSGLKSEELEVVTSDREWTILEILDTHDPCATATAIAEHPDCPVGSRTVRNHLNKLAEGSEKVHYSKQSGAKLWYIDTPVTPASVSENLDELSEHQRQQLAGEILDEYPTATNVSKALKSLTDTDLRRAAETDGRLKFLSPSERRLSFLASLRNFCGILAATSFFFFMAEMFMRLQFGTGGIPVLTGEHFFFFAILTAIATVVVQSLHFLLWIREYVPEDVNALEYIIKGSVH